MKILHVDVDGAIGALLPSGIRQEGPLTPKTVSRITGKSQIECITCKSQSLLTSAVLSQFPKLKLIVARTVGTDMIDGAYCKTHAVALYHVPDYGSHVVAEHALALLLAGARFVVPAANEVRKGKFSYRPFLGKALSGKTIGVIGTGRIGQEFIKRIRALDVTILGYDVVKLPNPGKLGFSYVSLPTLLSASDAISIHVPLLPQTEHMIGSSELKLMKKGSILVNTSRGAIINTKALLKHIKKFHAVCLDVLEDEAGFSNKHPLLTHPNVTITPHIGFYTDTSVARIAKETLSAIDKFQRGDSEGRVV